MARDAKQEFGRRLREKHFSFGDFLNLNHGSFGTYPKVVRDELRGFQDRAEGRPDPFIRYEYPKLLDKSREAMGAFLNVPTEEIVFVPNATTGVNTVLRALAFEAGDKILYFSTIYGACEKTVSYICETTPAEPVRIEVECPISDGKFVEMLRQTLSENDTDNGRVKIVVCDTVSSLPGVRVPFEKVIAVCREQGVLSLIDGAHGVGHIPLDLGKLQPDFFVSNCHKWLFVPRGCAVFHVPVRNQHLIKSTLPTSHSFEPQPKPGQRINNPLPPSTKSPFVTNFEFVGTIDNANYLTIPTALEFRREVCGGEETIYRYCNDLARRGGEIVADSLGTEVLENEERTLGECCFSCVRVPLGARELFREFGENKVKAKIMGWLCDENMTSSNTFLAYFWLPSGLWVRLSAQVYLGIDDFAVAAEALKRGIRRVERELEGLRRSQRAP